MATKRKAEKVLRCNECGAIVRVFGDALAHYCPVEGCSGCLIRVPWMTPKRRKAVRRVKKGGR
jgi:hypothetical protein